MKPRYSAFCSIYCLPLAELVAATKDSRSRRTIQTCAILFSVSKTSLATAKSITDGEWKIATLVALLSTKSSTMLGRILQLSTYSSRHGLTQEIGRKKSVKKKEWCCCIALNTSSYLVGAVHKALPQDWEDEPHCLHCEFRRSSRPLHGLQLCLTGGDCVPLLHLLRTSLQQLLCCQVGRQLPRQWGRQ